MAATFISLTALPAQTASPAQALVIEGYSVQVWRDGGTNYWAISDIDPAELSKFRQLFEAAAKAGWAASARARSANCAGDLDVVVYRERNQ